METMFSSFHISSILMVAFPRERKDLTFLSSAVSSGRAITLKCQLLVDKETEGKTEDASMRTLLQRNMMVDVQAEWRMDKTSMLLVNKRKSNGI